jgi:hypothetical protein
MSSIFTVTSSAPVITSSTEIITTNGEAIFISGEEFLQNITKVSGQNIYNSSLDFLSYGIYNQNISGIDNTISSNAITFTLKDIPLSKYKLYLYNEGGISENYINLQVFGQPTISGFDKKNVLPGEYIKVSGSNFNPGANILFIDENKKTVVSSFQETGLYRITGGEIINYGTGYNSGDIFYLQGLKNYYSNSYAVLQVSTTGINGSLGSFDIVNSGVFTVPNLNTGIEFAPNIGNGEGALINFLYEKYQNTGLVDFIEFQVPYNITRNQSGIIENIKYKGPISGALFNNFYISGNPSIYGFDSKKGTVDIDRIILSGDNLSSVQKIRIGNQLVQNYINLGDTGISFIIPNFSSSDYIYVSGKYWEDKSKDILNVFYPAVTATGYTPNAVLAGTGVVISISGKYLQRINYINLGQPNVLRKDIIVNSSGNVASFVLPNAYTTTSLKIFSVDFPSSGTLIAAPNSNNLLISDVMLSESNLNIRYLSGIQAAKYLDEIEIYSSSGTSGDYGNLTNSDVFFLGITGSIEEPNAYNISGIKINNSPTGIRFKVPREVRNPQARIKIKRNKFGDSYILSSNKSIDVLPTIYDVTPSNTLYNSLGYLTISGINASNINLIYFSGYSGTKNILGFKDVENLPLTIVSKNLTQITGVNGIGGSSSGYSVIEAKLGGDVTGSGELFLFNNYYDTGIGYENEIITKNKNIKVSAISGFRPPNSDIFTISPYVTSPLDAAFFYKIETNSRATRFEFSATTSSGVGDGTFPTGLENFLNPRNEIFGQPSVGGFYYLKIRALDGERPNEGMILNLNIGGSGRAISSPGITFRGEWSNTVAYIGSSVRRDVVKYNNDGINYWYAAYTNINSEPKLGSQDWIQFSNEFSATATKILLAEDSTITNSLNIGEAGILSGFIKTSTDQNVDIGSGFFLGFDNRYNYGLPKFRVGNEDGYIKFDGNSLNIAGPISGIITSSKNIKNSNNIVDSENSVAIGVSNYIYSDTDNIFIFGSNNNVSGSQRSTILGGKNNIISNLINGTAAIDSSIVGGENNNIIGSFCTINGGLSNVIRSLSTGLTSLANQSFKTSFIPGTLSARCNYPSTIFTNDLVIFNNIETSRLGNLAFGVSWSKPSNIYSDPIYRSKNMSDVTTQSYLFSLDFAAGLSGNTVNNENLKINSWVGIATDNLFSGSFSGINSNKPLEFKVGKTPLETGTKLIRVNFKNPFVNYQKEDILVLAQPITSGNLSSAADSSDQIVDISGVDISGFYIDFPDIRTDKNYASFRAGPTGWYTGVSFNNNLSLDINRVQPFKNFTTYNNSVDAATNTVNGSYNMNLGNRGAICFAKTDKYYNSNYQMMVADHTVGNSLYMDIFGGLSYPEENLSTSVLNIPNKIVLTGSASGPMKSDTVIFDLTGTRIPMESYFNLTMLGFNGTISNNYNLQVFQTQINQGYGMQHILLPSGFENLESYVPIVNIFTTGAQIDLSKSGVAEKLSEGLYRMYPWRTYGFPAADQNMSESDGTTYDIQILRSSTGLAYANIGYNYGPKIFPMNGGSGFNVVFLHTLGASQGGLNYNGAKTYRTPNKDYLLNVAAFRTGNYIIDNCDIEVNRILVSNPTFSPSNNKLIIPQNINFKQSFNSKPTVFAYLEEITSGVVAPGISIKEIFNSGFRLHQTGTLISWGHSTREYYLNYIAIGGTGTNTLAIKNVELINSGIKTSNENIEVPFNDTFKQPFNNIKIFSKLYTNDYTYIHNVYLNSDASFGFHLPTDLPLNLLTGSSGLKIDYMATDLERDLNFLGEDLTTAEYNRLSTFGFNDVGSSNIAGGSGNYVEGVVSTIGGGVGNRIIGDFNLIAGGRSNIISDHEVSVYNLYPQINFCSILGGVNNAITGNVKYCNILGGQDNLLRNDNEFLVLNASNILGGASNKLSGEYSNIFGGRNNVLSGNNSNIIGNNNIVVKSGISGLDADYSNIIGYFNTSSSSSSTIIGSGNRIFEENTSNLANYNFILGNSNVSKAHSSVVIGNNSFIDYRNTGIVYIGDSSAFRGHSGRYFDRVFQQNSMIIDMSGGLIITGNTLHPYHAWLKRESSTYSWYNRTPLIFSPEHMPIAKAFPDSEANVGRVGEDGQSVNLVKVGPIHTRYSNTYPFPGTTFNFFVFPTQVPIGGVYLHTGLYGNVDCPPVLCVRTKVNNYL